MSGVGSKERLKVFANHLEVDLNVLELTNEDQLYQKLLGVDVFRVSAALRACLPGDKELSGLLFAGNDATIRRCAARWVYAGSWQFSMPRRIAAAF